MNDNTALWWVIKGPVVGSIMVSIFGTRTGKRQGLGQKTGEGGKNRDHCTSQPSPFSWLHYIRQDACTSYLASPLVLDIYIFSFFLIMKNATRSNYVRHFEHEYFFRLNL